MARAVGMLNSSESGAGKLGPVVGWEFAFGGKTLEDEVAQGNARFALKRMSLWFLSTEEHGGKENGNSQRKEKE